MLNYFFTSDLHYGHSKILTYNPNRSKIGRREVKNVLDMNEAILELINTTVGPTGTLYDLGDFSFMPDADVVNLMSRYEVASCHMVFGNHCPKNKYRLVQEANSRIGRELFRVIGHYAEIRIPREMSTEVPSVVMSHYPMRDWNKAHHGAMQVHGHMHGSLVPLGRSVDVGIDSPHVDGERGQIFSLEKLLRWAEKIPRLKVGHHSEKRSD